MVAITQSEISGFHFQILLRLAPSYHLFSTEPELLLTEQDSRPIVYVHSHNGVALQESDEIILKGLCFGSELEAKLAGAKYVHAIKRVALERQIGLAQIGELDVWSGLKIRFELSASLRARAQTGVNAAQFCSSILAALDSPVLPSRDQTRLFEILMRCYFETSMRSRLLLAMAIIEIRFKRERKSQQHRDELDKLKQVAQVYVRNKDLRKAIEDDLERGKQTSQRQSCRDGLIELLDEDAVNEYDRLSKVRNKVAHDALSESEAGRAAVEATELARRVVLAIEDRQGKGKLSKNRNRN